MSVSATKTNPTAKRRTSRTKPKAVQLTKLHVFDFAKDPEFAAFEKAFAATQLAAQNVIAAKFAAQKAESDDSEEDAYLDHFEFCFNAAQNVKARATRSTQRKSKKPTKIWHARLIQLINQRTHTVKTIVPILTLEFPMYAKESHGNLISSNKNPKYAVFPKLIIQNKQTKILSFAA